MVHQEKVQQQHENQQEEQQATFERTFAYTPELKKKIKARNKYFHRGKAISSSILYSKDLEIYYDTLGLIKRKWHYEYRPEKGWHVLFENVPHVTSLDLLNKEYASAAAKQNSPKPRSIDSSKDQVTATYLNFARSQHGTKALSSKQKRVDDAAAGLVVSLGTQPLFLLSKLYVTLFHCLNVRPCYAKSAILHTIPGISENDWIDATQSHSDFDFSDDYIIPNDLLALTLWMPLQEPGSLLMGSLAKENPRGAQELELILNPGDFVVFSYKQYHRTSLPVHFPSKPSRRFHIMLSSDETLIADLDKDAVSLHPNPPNDPPTLHRKQTTKKKI